ncbi:MAG: M48 family metalloprotease [Pseudomonadota bacterium]
MVSRAAPALAALWLAGCAATGELDRARLVAPGEVGAVYSEVELQTALALTADAPCQPGGCAEAEAFGARVLRLGEWLGMTATGLAIERGIEVPGFSVVVPGKDDIGTLSSAAGSVIVFDGVRGLELEDPALAFLIAREMGHVIARHHEENSGNSIAVSVIVSLLFPVAGLLQGAEAVYAASAVNSSIVTTAASYAGSRALRSLYEDDQRREADEHALLILVRAGWTPHEVAAALREAAPRLHGDGWLAELRASRRWLEGMVAGPFPEALLETVEAPAERFGPRLAGESWWIASLYAGAWGGQRYCLARLPTAEAGAAAPPAQTQPAQKTVKKPAKKASKFKKAKRPKKPTRTTKRKKRGKHAATRRVRPA